MLKTVVPRLQEYSAPIHFSVKMHTFTVEIKNFTALDKTNKQKKTVLVQG